MASESAASRDSTVAAGDDYDDDNILIGSMDNKVQCRGMIILEEEEKKVAPVDEVDVFTLPAGVVAAASTELHASSSSSSSAVPIAPSPPQLQQQRHHVQHGAFPVSADQVSRDTPTTQRAGTTTQNRNGNQGWYRQSQFELVQATLVEEPESTGMELNQTDAVGSYGGAPMQIARAEPIAKQPDKHCCGGNSDSSFRSRCGKRGVILIMIVCVVLGASATGITAPLLSRGRGDSSDSSQDGNSGDSDGNRQIELFLQELPNETLVRVQEAFSPQSRAFAWLAQSPAVLEQISIDRVIQRFVLATLFYATNGDRWAETAGWLSKSSECKWWFSSPATGNGNGEVASNPIPICDERDNLVSLRLSGNELDGTVPPELVLLSSLELIDLANNRLSGETLLRNLGQLVRLESLVVSDNRFNGVIPSELGQAESLQLLDIRNNHLTGVVPDGLCELVQAQALELHVDCDEVQCSCRCLCNSSHTTILFEGDATANGDNNNNNT